MTANRKRGHAISLYATRQEIAQIVGRTVADYRLFPAVAFWPPTRIEIRQPNEGDFLNQDLVDVYLCADVPRPSPSNQLVFLDENPGTICVTFDKPKDGILSECLISSMTAHDAWLGVAKTVRSLSKTGLTVIGASGERAVLKASRYTEGAKEWFLSGKRLSTIVGQPVVLDELG